MKKTYLNQYESTKEVISNNSLFAIDYLKIKVKITHNPDQLANRIIVPFVKFADEFMPSQHSYSKQWVHNSYNNDIQIKSINENELLIQGNLFKWLNGHNVTGSTNLIQLVSNIVAELCRLFDALQPTPLDLENIKQGAFKIHRIDINKALIFPSKDQAQQYLALIKEHSSYPRRKREVKNNGIYFGLGSKRTTLLYYYKGQEVKSHKKQQVKITAELQAYADLMIRCEVRLFNQELKDNELQYGYCWDEVLVQELIEHYHSLLNLPEPISEMALPPKYLKFIAASKQGVLPLTYSGSTIIRYKRDLAKMYGVLL